MIKKKITIVLAVGAILSLPLLSSCQTKKILAQQQAELSQLQQEIDLKTYELAGLRAEIQDLKAQRDQLKK